MTRPEHVERMLAAFDDAHRHAPRLWPEQLELPFLTPDRAGAITAAQAAIERACAAAVAGRRWADADELTRIGLDLLRILEDNAAAVRAAVT